MLAPPRARRALRRPPRLGPARLARRPARDRAGAARADARRRRDARRGDVGRVPGPDRRPARVRPSGAERLGPRLRAARPEVPALDGLAKLAAHVRPFRPQRHVPLGRSRAGRRALLPHRPRVRRLGRGSLAGPVRRSPVRAAPLDQVTQCYKRRNRSVTVPSRARNTVLLAAASLACAWLAGCGSEAPRSGGSARPPLTAGDLLGWRAVSAPPGIGELASGLTGTDVTGRADAPALVRAGDVIRASRPRLRLRIGRARSAEAGIGRRLPGRARAGLPRRHRRPGPGVAYTASCAPADRGGRRHGRDLPDPERATGDDRRARLGRAPLRPGASAARVLGARQSLNSGRTNSSKVARSQLATTAGVIARTEAVRDMPIASPTSPK